LRRGEQPNRLVLHGPVDLEQCPARRRGHFTRHRFLVPRSLRRSRKMGIAASRGPDGAAVLYDADTGQFVCVSTVTTRGLMLGRATAIATPGLAPRGRHILHLIDAGEQVSRHLPGC
jgi:hypothetical protein